MNKPSHKVVAKKAPKAKKARAASPKDWDKQEAAEGPLSAKPEPDEINRVVGSSIFLTPYSSPDWKDPLTSRRFTISRWYPHKAVGVDFPRTEAEGRDKVAFFKARNLKVIVVQLGQTLDTIQLSKLARA